MKKNSIVRKLIITFSSITEIVETLNKQLDVVSEAVGSYLKAQEGSYEEINRLLKISCLSNNMDGIIVDRLGYIYMVSNEEYANLKYTNIDITEYNIPNSKIFCWIISS